MRFQKPVFSIAVFFLSTELQSAKYKCRHSIQIIIKYIRTFILTDFTVILRTSTIDMKVAKSDQIKQKSSFHYYILYLTENIFNI